MGKKQSVIVDSSDLVLEIFKEKIDPKIYAFSTDFVPGALKVGDTYRAIEERLNEWKAVYPDLQQEGQTLSAKINNDLYFRDYSVHEYLERYKKRHNLTKAELEEKYYSSEFFEGATYEDVSEAVKAILDDYESGKRTYPLYDLNKPGAKTEPHYKRGQQHWDLRDNQKAVVKKFTAAWKKGRTNLLMFAVMRFGKTFTALHCGKKMGAKLIVVVTAKPQVKKEWKETLEVPDCFLDYQFVTETTLKKDHDAIKKILTSRKKPNRAVVFLSLQDLNGSTIKAKHSDLFTQDVDLLIVDESHFGARALSYGRPIRTELLKDCKEPEDQGVADFDKANAQVQAFKKQIKTKVTLHLSGTPYRILMSNEFSDEDIIAAVQYADIVKAKQDWYADRKNLDKDEFENPYYGFPQMIRFAFDLNESSKELLKKMRDCGIPFGLSDLFTPQSKNKDNSGNDRHCKFIHEKEVLDFLRAIDGSDETHELFPFLDNADIKRADLCRHMVFVLPFRASCDAMEKLLSDHESEFKHLSKSDYEILNISGFNSKAYKNTDKVADAIESFEKQNRKTITLTVNKMLTGSTVEEWDTMVFLRESHSAQEYDQAIYRLQSPYLVRIVSSDGKESKIDKKPQTLLIDYEPARLFRMEEEKAIVYDGKNRPANIKELQKRIKNSLALSPIITFNAGKLERVQANNLIDRISKYSEMRGIMEESATLPIDCGLFDDPAIVDLLEKQNPIDSKAGFEEAANQQEGKTNLDVPSADASSGQNIENEPRKVLEKQKEDDFKKRLQRYYCRILSFAFLAESKTELSSLSDLIRIIDEGENKRIARHLSLSKTDLSLLNSKMASDAKVFLELRIHNFHKLANDASDDSKEFAHRAKLAVRKFNSFGEAEVMTPNHVVSAMIDSVGRGKIRATLDAGGHILDIASKTGEFALAIVEDYINNGGDINKIRKSIYSIPTSFFTYEFVLKTYRLIGLDESCIAHFTAYDDMAMAQRQLDDDPKKNLELIRKKLEEDKPFSEIVWNEKSKEDFDGKEESL